jgi:hypothetical protein
VGRSDYQNRISSLFVLDKPTAAPVRCSEFFPGSGTNEGFSGLSRPQQELTMTQNHFSFAVGSVDSTHHPSTLYRANVFGSPHVFRTLSKTILPNPSKRASVCKAVRSAMRVSDPIVTRKPHGPFFLLPTQGVGNTTGSKRT